jgi:hypothetical protein
MAPATLQERVVSRWQHVLPPWELYQVWQAAFAEADAALGAWFRAPAGDREDVAAARWLAA